jgi:hypothetical protein
MTQVGEEDLGLGPVAAGQRDLVLDLLLADGRRERGLVERDRRAAAADLAIRNCLSLVESYRTTVIRTNVLF